MRTLKLTIIAIMLFAVVATCCHAANWLPFDGIMLKLGSVRLSGQYLIFEPSNYLLFGIEKLTF